MPPGASVADDVAEIIAAVRARRRRGAATSSRRASAARDAAARRRRGARAALDALDAATCAPGSRSRSRNVRAVAEAGLDEDRAVTLPEGQTVTLREVPVRRAGGLRARRPQPVSVDGRDGRVTARAAGVDEVVRRRARRTR